MLVSSEKKLHFQRIDKRLQLSPGLKKVLSTQTSTMTRLEIMDRLIEKLHFLKMHNVLTPKNFALPKRWKTLLKTERDYVDELDLLEIIASNT